MPGDAPGLSICDFMKQIFITFSSFLSIFLLSLPLAGCSQMEKTEEITADIEAAQMAGRNAARVYIQSAPRDSLETQAALLRARAACPSNEPAVRAAFDSVFLRTIRTVK